MMNVSAACSRWFSVSECCLSNTACRCSPWTCIPSVFFNVCLFLPAGSSVSFVVQHWRHKTVTFNISWLKFPLVNVQWDIKARLLWREHREMSQGLIHFPGNLLNHIILSGYKAVKHKYHISSWLAGHVLFHPINLQLASFKDFEPPALISPILHSCDAKHCHRQTGISNQEQMSA